MGSWVLPGHPTGWELLPEILTQLVWAEAEASVFRKHHLGTSSVQRTKSYYNPQSSLKDEG